MDRVQHDVTMARRLASALFALVVVSGLAFTVGQRESAQIRLTAWDPARDADLAVTVRGRELVPAVPAEQAVKLPSEEMLQVGEQGGVALWARRSPGGGGGGGTEQGSYPGPQTGPDGLDVAPADRIERGAWGTLYVRVADGKFVPLGDRPRVPLRMQRLDRAAMP